MIVHLTDLNISQQEKLTQMGSLQVTKLKQHQDHRDYLCNYKELKKDEKVIDKSNYSLNTSEDSVLRA